MIDKISVIMPYYNNKNSIIESVRSVLDQSSTAEIILIIIDDGSDTSPKNLINNEFSKVFSNNSNRKIKIITQENSGAATARNRGVQEAKTEFIAFLDSDDLWKRDKIKIQLDYINKYNLSVIGSDWNDSTHFISRANKEMYKLNKLSIAIQWWPHISTILIKKSLVLKIGTLNKIFYYAEDGDFFINIATHTDFNIIKQSLVTCHSFKRFEFADGLSSNLLEMHVDEMNTIKKHFNNIFIRYTLYLYARFKYFKRLLKRLIFNFIK